MTRGRELPVNSKVRRQLFPEDGPVKPWDGLDYASKVINKEYIARTLHNDIIFKGMKWNFDFFNDIPTSGLIKWYKERNNGLWVGMQPSGHSVRLQKRMNSGGGMKSVYADERSKKRRLSQHIADQRRSFFNDGRSMDCAIKQCESENLMNDLIVDLPTHPGSYEGPLEVPRCRRFGIYWLTSRHDQNVEPTADFGVTRRVLDRAQVHTNDHQSLYNLSSTQPVPNYSPIQSSKYHNVDTEEANGYIAKKRKETKEEEKEGTMEERIEELNGTSSNNVATNNDREMKKKDKVEFLAKDDFENLRIADITDTNMEDEELNDVKDINELNDMKELNEATPKTAKGPGSPTKNIVTVQSVKEKARRKLYNYRFDI